MVEEKFKKEEKFQKKTRVSRKEQVLRLLKSSQEEIKASEIALMLQMNISQLSRLLKKLEKENLIETERRRVGSSYVRFVRLKSKKPVVEKKPEINKEIRIEPKKQEKKREPIIIQTSPRVTTVESESTKSEITMLRKLIEDQASQISRLQRKLNDIERERQNQQVDQQIQSLQQQIQILQNQLVQIQQIQTQLPDVNAIIRELRNMQNDPEAARNYRGALTYLLRTRERAAPRANLIAAILEAINRAQNR